MNLQEKEIVDAALRIAFDQPLSVQTWISFCLMNGINDKIPKSGRRVKDMAHQVLLQAIYFEEYDGK